MKNVKVVVLVDGEIAAEADAEVSDRVAGYIVGAVLAQVTDPISESEIDS